MASVSVEVNPAPRSRFLHQALGTYGTQLLMAVFGMVSSVIIARALGPAGRGQYAVAMALGVIGVQLGNLGLHSSNSYFLARDRSLLPRLLGNALLISVVLGGTAAAALVVFFSFWRGAPLQGRLLWLAALWIPLGLAYLLLVNLLIGLLEVKLYNTIELANKILATSLVVAMVWFSARSPDLMFAAVLGALVISLCYALWKLNTFCPAPPKLSAELFRGNFQLGWKAYLSCFFAFLVIRIDLLMVRSMQGAAAAGYYSIAGAIADYTLLLPIAIGAILFPRLSAMTDPARKWSMTRRAVVSTGAGLAALLLVLWFSIKVVVLVLFGNAFAPAATAFLLLSPGILFLGLETVLVQYLNSCGFPAGVVVLWIATTAVNIGLNLWAIPAYGINGAAAVSSLSYFFAAVGVGWIAIRNRKLHRLSTNLHAEVASYNIPRASL